MNEKYNEALSIRKEFNIGIAVLRVFLSFMVVMDHIYNKQKIKNYLRFLYYHIPSFFLISFYFTYRTLSSFNIPKVKLRIERLLIPYFSWCTISWIIRNIFCYILKKNCRYSLTDYIINLLNGHIFNVVLWFQNILILVTFIFLIIIYAFKRYYLFILILLGIIAYLFQYSGANYYFFNKYFSVHYRLTFGRFAEAFPNAVTGFIFASTDILNNLKKKKILTIFYSLLILIIITKYNIFNEIKTFKYGGIRLNIAASCIFLIFSLISFKIRGKFINNIILQFTKYTAGIYFTHYLIGKVILYKSIKLIEDGTIKGCALVYLISYIVCFIGANIFKKTKFRHLFI